MSNPKKLGTTPAESGLLLPSIMLGNPILVNSLVINSCIRCRLCSYAPFIFTRKWGKVESKHTLHMAANSALANGDSWLVGPPPYTTFRFSSTYLKWWSHMGCFSPKPYKTNTVSPSKKYLGERWRFHVFNHFYTFPVLSSIYRYPFWQITW